MADMIRWPAEHDPTDAGVYVVNELSMEAPPAVVWAWLARAPLWPEWYPNSKDVVLQGPDKNLKYGTQFRWNTFGVNIASTVLEFEPYESLAWDSQAFGINAYHAWLIEKTETGCHVTTEETQSGIMARLQKLFMPNRMQQQHQIWLERLAEMAKTGLPPD